MTRRAKKRRYVPYSKGETRPAAKLTAADVKLMRKMRDEQFWEGYLVTPKLLAEWFYCDVSQVYRILSGEAFKHVQ